MSSFDLRICIAADLSQVRGAAAALRGVLTDLGCGAEQLAAIEMCAVEAINNAIEHACVAQSGQQVGLVISCAPEHLKLEVRDRGVSMPPGTLERTREALHARDSTAPPMEVEDLAEGGYGLSLILQVMDDVRYARDGDENRLLMTLRLQELGDAPVNERRPTAGA